MPETFACGLHGVRMTVTVDAGSGREHRDIRGGRAACALKDGLPLENLRALAQGEQFKHEGRPYPRTHSVGVAGDVTFERENISRQEG